MTFTDARPRVLSQKYRHVLNLGGAWLRKGDKKNANAKTGQHSFLFLFPSLYTTDTVFFVKRGDALSFSTLASRIDSWQMRTSSFRQH